MELRDLIEAGINKKRTVTALADYLGIHPNHVSNAKAHQRGIPADACVKLSELLRVDLKTVIAASELVTERKEEKRAFWLPFVTNARDMTKAASIALILATVTNFVTTTPAEAAPVRDSSSSRVCIMSTRKIFSCIAGFLSNYVGFLQKRLITRPCRFLVTG
jgi:plasmid maintenance system antidote protein VapI